MADGGSLKVLIADDEPLAVERLQLLLARSDGAALVGTASDGESAVSLSEALAPDLLLLDIAMPGLDGIGVARALAAQSPSPAVVFVTAFDQFAVAAFEVEAVDYLMKPVEPLRLQRAIGVIYRPETERQSHYFHTRLAGQFDAMIHIDETSALEPLDKGSVWSSSGEAPETFPSGI